MSPIIPDLVNFGSSLFGAFYFLMNAKNVNSLPIFSLILFMNIHLFFINSILAKISDSKIEIFSIDPEFGCLGFFNPKIAFITFVPFGILSSVCGSAGYVLCLLFYTPLAVTNAYLLEPIVAQLLGYFLKIDKMPGIMTFIGTAVTLLGIILIDYTVRNKENIRIQNEKQDNLIRELKANTAA